VFDDRDDVAAHGLPVTGHSIQDERRRQDRTRHFLGRIPGGSWVAEEGRTIVGMSQSFVREDYWMLSQLGTVPGRQGRGVGRELEVVTAIDRKVRGSARTVDIVAVLAQPGSRLLLHADQGYAVAKDEHGGIRR
jgi:hypothetical protein